MMLELSPQQRAALDLVDLQGFSAEEASEMLELAPSTVRVHLHRARGVLLRVVPTAAYLVLDDDAFERWPSLESAELSVDVGGFRVRSIEQRSARGTEQIVTLETAPMGLPFGLFFYSAFLTSVWLWLYVAAVILSRFLLRMNNGVGFLLRASDVEQQPFRSMGFVSVIIVSGLFALGLPLVLF